MSSLLGMVNWCEGKFQEARAELRKRLVKQRQQVMGPCLTPKDVPLFIIPQHRQTPHPGERKLCVEEELRLNKNLAFHTHKAQEKPQNAKLENIRTKQYQVCLASRKRVSLHPEESKNGGEIQISEDNQALLPVMFPTIDVMPSVYFGQTDKPKMGSFFKTKTVQP